MSVAGAGARLVARRDAPDFATPPTMHGAPALAAVLLTVVASCLAAALGLKLGVLAVLVGALFVGAVVAFLMVPHWAIAGTVVLYPLVPALKVFINTNLGAVKDLVDLAAICAGVLIVAFERRRPDPWVATSVLLLLAIYVINPGHAHDTAWGQGVRLVGEPLLLLLVGFVLPNPERNLRYGFGALLAIACAVAAYGLLQQLLGAARLVSLGYSYAAQVRTIGAFLRSFGTLDDPFEYAALLLLGLGLVFFWLRRGPHIAWITALLLAGLLASFVRTGVLVLVGYLGLWLVRRGRMVPAMMFVAAAVVAASLTLAKSSGTQVTTLTVYPANSAAASVQVPVPGPTSLLLNGRLSAWSIALGHDPGDWLFGRGVGTVGTAAARATYTFATSATQSVSQAVDSAYFATIADVGLVGLAVAVALWARLIVLGVRYARRGSDAAWAALAIIACILLDGLTRAVFTEFPTMFLGTLLIGTALAAASDADAEARPPSRPGLVA